MPASTPFHAIPGFLSPDFCLTVREAMDRGGEDPAEVLADEVELQEAVRRTSSVDVAQAVVGEVERRLEAVRDTLSGFAQAALGEREGAGFLRYRPGGFYRPHRDRGDVPSWPGAARRRVAVVIFLNDSQASSADGGFSGGALRLFPGDPHAAAIDVQPRAGLLVAFPADLLHEVTVVHGGVRDVIVDWFY